jgi:hypothetical protein
MATKPNTIIIIIFFFFFFIDSTFLCGLWPPEGSAGLLYS